jgi:hypothetical protein
MRLIKKNCSFGLGMRGEKMIKDACPMGIYA